jgi:hypothetical protein
MNKKIRTTLFVALITGVLCAGTVSARQLSLTATAQTSCRGFCTKKTGCPNILGCACVITQPGSTIGMCELIAARPGQ